MVQLGWTRGQRPAKAQPGGSWMGLGGSPPKATTPPGARSKDGAAAKSARVYGCKAEASWALGSTSTLRPK